MLGFDMNGTECELFDPGSTFNVSSKCEVEHLPSILVSLDA